MSGSGCVWLRRLRWARLLLSQKIGRRVSPSGFRQHRQRGPVSGAWFEGQHCFASQASVSVHEPGFPCQERPLDALHRPALSRELQPLPVFSGKAGEQWPLGLVSLGARNPESMFSRRRRAGWCCTAVGLDNVGGLVGVKIIEV